MYKKFILCLISCLLLITACSSTAGESQEISPDLPITEPTVLPSPTNAPEPTSTPAPLGGSLEGVLHSYDSTPVPLANTNIVLCKVQETFLDDALSSNILEVTCKLDASLRTTTDDEGHFEFCELPSGQYVLQYEKTNIDFDQALADWDGKIFIHGNEGWYIDLVSDGLIQSTVTEARNFAISAFGDLTNGYANMYLVVYSGGYEGFPFGVPFEYIEDDAYVGAVVIDIADGEVTSMDIPVFPLSD